MNPVLRSRLLTPRNGAALALLLLAAGLPALRAAARSAGSKPGSQAHFLKAAKQVGHSALADIKHPRPASAARAQPGVPATTQSQPSQLSDLGWLAGRWVGKWGPRTAEQVWTAPQAGLMLGAFRLFEDDRTLVVELFTLEQKPDGVVLRFRHFTPDLVPWEKNKTAHLTLQSFDSKKWVFLNAGDGQPKRSIIIWVDANTYTLRSEIASGSSPLRVVDITFHRQGIPARKSSKK